MIPNIDIVATDDFHAHYSDPSAELSTAQSAIVDGLESSLSPAPAVWEWDEVALPVDTGDGSGTDCTTALRHSEADESLADGNGPFSYEMSDFWVILDYCDEAGLGGPGQAYTGSAGLNQNASCIVNVPRGPVHDTIWIDAVHEIGHGFTGCHSEGEIFDNVASPMVSPADTDDLCWHLGDFEQSTMSFSQCAEPPIQQRVDAISNQDPISRDGC